MGLTHAALRSHLLHSVMSGVRSESEETPEEGKLERECDSANSNKILLMEMTKETQAFAWLN